MGTVPPGSTCVFADRLSLQQGVRFRPEPRPSSTRGGRWELGWLRPLLSGQGGALGRAHRGAGIGVRTGRRFRIAKDLLFSGGHVSTRFSHLNTCVPSLARFRAARAKTFS